MKLLVSKLKTSHKMTQDEASVSKLKTSRKIKLPVSKLKNSRKMTQDEAIGLYAEDFTQDEALCL